MQPAQSRLRWGRFPLLSALVLLILAGCAAPPAPPAPTGSLQITITGLPTGQDADISVNGPQNYGTTLTQNTTLSGLTPGSYSIQAGTIIITTVTSEFVATITPSSADVIADETAMVMVDYALAGGTLAVAISGLPPGVSGDVTVSGPDAFSQAVSTSTVLTDVAPGEYSAVASSVTNGSDNYTPTVLGSPAEVSSSSGAGIEVSYALDVGSLDVTITGLPVGVDADVLVAGANGFSQLITQSSTLTDLTPGVYTLSSGSVRTDDPIVSEIYNLVAPLATIEVISGATASTSATYALRPGSGTLWLAQFSGDVLGFSAEHLATSTSSTPEVTLTTAAISEEGVVVDGDGDLWVIDQSGQAVEYDVSDLGADGSPSAKVTITGLPSIPLGGAFDDAGSLWIASFAGNTVVEFRADQLLVDGAPTPNVTITGFDAPVGVAFDAAGNLWVANSTPNTVVMFTPAQLLVGGALVPEVTISANAGSLSLPTGVAFDAAGNLWVSNGGSATVVKFTLSQLAASGSPAPDVTISANAGSLALPVGLAFDNSGDLWVDNGGGGSLVQFSGVGGLSGAVSPVPTTTIAVAGLNIPFLAFLRGLSRGLCKQPES